MANSINFSSDSNRGTQLGINYGHVTNNYNQPGEGSSIKPELKPKPCSTVPFRQDLDFVDRNIFTEVDEICSKPASRAALVGLGGVGKSQLAIEYSYRMRKKFPQMWIFWVHSSNAARFEEGYRLIAERIRLPRRDEPKANILRLVSDWLSDEANGRWMMILDNADDSAVFSDPRNGGTTSGVHAAVPLSNFLPQTPNGSILVTSRSEDAAFALTGRHLDIIKVEPMNEEYALLLLEKKVRGKFQTSDAIELLRALDYMPLAISQAAAYISQRAPRITVAKYLDIFRQSDENQTSLLNRDAADLRRDREAVNSIITTWQISFEYIRAKTPSAARLLSLMSFFDRQGIPEFLLYRYDDKEDGSNIELDDIKDESLLMFEDDVFTLTSYSLIKASVVDKQFEMHRLVQLSTRKWLQCNSELEKWKKIYISIMLRAFPNADYENWKVCQVLFPHAEAVLAYRPDEKKYLFHWSEILLKAGVYAAVQGNYLKAEEMSRRALDERTKMLGEEHPDTRESVHLLASVLMVQGKYSKAEEMSRRALDKRTKMLGNKHPDTLRSARSLAWALMAQRNFVEAEELSRQALDRREKALWKEDPNTLTVDLATVLMKQKKYEAAEELYRQALDAAEKALGKEHPSTLGAVNFLAMVLMEQGKYEAAEELHRRALDGNEKALGKEHPGTLMTVNFLATVLMKQGKYKAAEELYRRALDGNEKTLGKEHPDTLTIVNILAMVLMEQGKYEAAEELYRRVVAGNEKTLGKEHPDTLTIVNILAMLLMKQGNYEAAEELYRRVVDGNEKSLGKEHPDTLGAVKFLAMVLIKQGNYEAAEELYRRVLDENEKTLGMEHSDTLTDVHMLAFLLHQQKQYQTATTLYERSCAGFRKVLGTDHPKTLAYFRNYVSMIVEMYSAPDQESAIAQRHENAAGH